MSGTPFSKVLLMASSEFSFQDLMAKALLRESHEESRRYNGNCPDTTNGRHAPPDVDGRCGWCGRKYTGKSMQGRTERRKSEIILAYEYAYDPDYGNDILDKY